MHFTRKVQQWKEKSAKCKTQEHLCVSLGSKRKSPVCLALCVCSSEAPPSRIRMTCALHLKPDLMLSNLLRSLYNPESCMMSFDIHCCQECVEATDYFSYFSRLKCVPVPFYYMSSVSPSFSLSLYASFFVSCQNKSGCHTL